MEDDGKVKPKYGPIRHFTDIEAWKRAREVRKAVYGIVPDLPKEERFDLASQMRRAAVSTTSNIAEGYGRFHYQENIQFCRISRGSLYEIQDHLITCLDNAYISGEVFEHATGLSEDAIRVLDGYIRYLKRQSKASQRAPNVNS